jgi:beta-phosphoglucomutase
MSKIKAIIFDMDGVLIDAKEWHYEALNRALSLFGYEIKRYDHLVTYDGLSTAQKLEMLSIEKGLPRKLHRFINELKQQYTMEKVHTDCHPLFIHEYALSTLRSNGYHIVVASNSIRNTVQIMMQKSNLLQYLDFYLSNQDVKKAKPDPEIYQTAISRLNLQPFECMIVEDNYNGIVAAKASMANVMEIKSVFDVNYENIIKHIEIFEKKNRKGFEIEHSCSNCK